MREDGDEHEDAGRRVQAEGEPDAQAVDEAVHGKTRGSQHSYLFVRAGLLRLIAVMEDERPLGEEEEQEARSDERAHASRVVDRVDRLGQNVEQSHSENDSPGECDQGRELAMKAQGDNASDERRDDDEQGRRNRNPGHRQSLQVP